jgi:hypothetical protein
MNDDLAALTELWKVSKQGTPHAIVHYLYVPSKTAALRVIAALNQQGFDTEDLLGANGVDWLVLARHTVVPTEELMTRTWQQMAQLAAQADGEYDGWEAKVNL